MNIKKLFWRTRRAIEFFLSIGKEFKGSVTATCAMNEEGICKGVYMLGHKICGTGRTAYIPISDWKKLTAHVQKQLEQ